MSKSKVDTQPLGCQVGCLLSLRFLSFSCFTISQDPNSEAEPNWRRITTILYQV